MDSSKWCDKYSVLQEFYVNVTPKMARPINPEQAHNIMKKYVLLWRVHTNTPETILLAVKTQMQYKLSFWDALIMAAAIQSKVKVLLTDVKLSLTSRHYQAELGNERESSKEYNRECRKAIKLPV